MRMLLFRLPSEVIRRNSMVDASKVLPLHYRALIGNVSQVSRVHSYSRALIRNISGDPKLSEAQLSNPALITNISGDSKAQLSNRVLFGNVSQVSSLHSYSGAPIINVSGDSEISNAHCSYCNSQSYLLQYLDKQIKLIESKCLNFTVHPGTIHAKLVKTGAKSDQLLCKQLRFYASSGYLPETVKIFNEAYFSNKAGLGVWNCYIISLAFHFHAEDLPVVQNVPRALTVFEDMPLSMVKTHATYWNAMVACSEAGETKYAQYLLARIFKSLAVEPSIEIMGCYIDALARNGQMEKAFSEAKSMIYKPNQEIIVSILFRYQMNPAPPVFANEVLSYVESQGVVFYIDKSTVGKLTKDGVTLNPCVKIKRGRRKGAAKWRE